MTLRLIDCHQHVFWYGKDDAGLIEDLDANNIELAWLLTWEEPLAQMGEKYAAHFDPRFRPTGSLESALPLHTVYETCRRYPDRFIAGYCPDPLDPQAPAKLSAAVDILKVRVCGEWKFSITFDDPRCIQLFRMAGKKKVPVLFHLDVPFLPPRQGAYVGNTRWKGGTMANVVNALVACPDTTFIGHGPGFWREMASNADDYPEVYLKPPLASPGKLPELLAQFPNLHADLSAGSALYALKADPAFARQFLLQYTSRILFGRDTFGNDLYQFLQSLDLPHAAWLKIGRENAQQILDPFTSSYRPESH